RLRQQRQPADLSPGPDAPALRRVCRPVLLLLLRPVLRLHELGAHRLDVPQRVAPRVCLGHRSVRRVPLHRRQRVQLHQRRLGPELPPLTPPPTPPPPPHPPPPRPTPPPPPH